MQLPTFKQPALELMAHLAWRPPAVVQPVVDIGSSTEALRADLLRQVEAGERKLQHWIERGRRLKARLWAVAHQIPAPSEQVELISDVIATIEAAAEEDARHIAGLQKLFRRQWREAHLGSADTAEMLQEIYGRALALAERELEERLELALFLRALRASIAPGAGTGQTFEDPAELERHLNSTLA